MGTTYGTNAEMDTMYGTPELVALFTDVLAHRKNATPDPNPRGCNLHEMYAPELGLSIIFHDDMGPAEFKGLVPPLAVVIHDHGTKGAVFFGNVDPDNIEDCLSCEWIRGDWENRLKQSN